MPTGTIPGFTLILGEEKGAPSSMRLCLVAQLNRERKIGHTHPQPDRRVSPRAFEHC